MHEKREGQGLTLINGADCQHKAEHDGERTHFYGCVGCGEVQGDKMQNKKLMAGMVVGDPFIGCLGPPGPNP